MPGQELVERWYVREKVLDCFDYFLIRKGHQTPDRTGEITEQTEITGNAFVSSASLRVRTLIEDMRLEERAPSYFRLFRNLSSFRCSHPGTKKLYSFAH
jgi:hypothetical protein